MEQVLLDSNILIYLLNGDRSIIRFFEKYPHTLFCISIISFIEVLAGSFHHQKTIKELHGELHHFLKLPISEPMAIRAAEFIQHDLRRGRRKRLQDNIIAATAIIHAMPLVTNNPSDFKHIRGLKLITPRPSFKIR